VEGESKRGKKKKKGVFSIFEDKASEDKASEVVTEEADICTCNTCGSMTCVTCDRPWHEGETCADYQARTKDRMNEEEKALREIQKVTKACPNCKKRIQKNGGCPYMHCSQCRVAFCVS
jgi:ariadne-1